MKLAKLKQVDLRKVWQHEASGFTKWLSSVENLSLLSDEIGIELTLLQTEAKVGKFQVDILAEEENIGRTVKIGEEICGGETEKDGNRGGFGQNLQHHSYFSIYFENTL